MALRSAGLRPRALHLSLALVAGAVAAVLLAAPAGVDERVTALVEPGRMAVEPLRGRVLGAELALASAVLGLGSLGLGLGLALGLGPRRRRRAACPDAVAAELAPGLARLLLSVAGLAAVLLILGASGALAAAARSVDAEPEALARVWVTWLGRGLLALAGVGLLVGAIERRLASGGLARARRRRLGPGRSR